MPHTVLREKGELDESIYLTRNHRRKKCEREKIGDCDVCAVLRPRTEMCRVRVSEFHNDVDVAQSAMLK